MTEYEIFTPTGIFTVEDTAPQDTTNAIQNTNN